MRLSSRRFGSLRAAHPAATAPIPMDYHELLAEITRAETFLALPTEQTDAITRIAVGLRLTRLTDARDAWDAHVTTTHAPAETLADVLQRVSA